MTQSFAEKPQSISSCGVVYDYAYLLHSIASTHPESPQRLKAILERLSTVGLLQKVPRIEPLADSKEVEAAILRIHSRQHFDSVKSCPTTGKVAFLAAAGVCAAVNAVMTSETIRRVFCAVRPPGHHAHNNGADYDGVGEGEGFCFFNNVAIAARYAQHVHGCKRIAILDWDFHHGNGTEWFFYDDPSVFFFSTHALFAYPGTGFPERTGSGPGRGYTLNVPLPPGSCDREIIEAWKYTLLPHLRDLAFKPDLVLISAGFDSRKEDLLGNFCVTDEGFATLTRIAMDLAKEHCHGRLVSVLEGGYNPHGLALAVERHVRELTNA